MIFQKRVFRVLLFVLVLLNAKVFAQLNAYSDYQQIRDQGFNNSNLRELAVHLTDAIGPRLSGSDGCINACSWAERTLKTFGIKNTVLQPWGEFGNGWQMDKFYIAMKEPYYQPLIAVPQAWTGSTEGFQISDVIMVFANSVDELEGYKGKLKGKVVITPYDEELQVSFEPSAKRFLNEDILRYGEVGDFNADPDIHMQTRKRSLSVDKNILSYTDFKGFCESEGAIAILENSGSYGTVRSYGDRSGRFLDNLGIPIIDMTHEHYARIVRLIDRGIPVKIELEVDSRLVSNNKTGYNVIAEIKGTNKKFADEVVVIGAHIDSWHAGTGGNDNASGVIVMMEVMRILKESGVTLNRTVRLALWTGEEQGLLGSKSWVSENVYNIDTNEKGPEFDKISAYYNFDYGTGRIRGIFVHNNLGLKPVFEEFFKPIDDLGVKVISLRNPGSSDHVTFNRVGVPGFAFIQDRIDYGRSYHTNMDTFERIQLGDLKQAAVVVATLVYQTANHPEKLPRKDVL